MMYIVMEMVVDMVWLLSTKNGFVNIEYDSINHKYIVMHPHIGLDWIVFQYWTEHHYSFHLPFTDNLTQSLDFYSKKGEVNPI